MRDWKLWIALFLVGTVVWAGAGPPVVWGPSAGSQTRAQWLVTPCPAASPYLTMNTRGVQICASGSGSGGFDPASPGPIGSTTPSTLRLSAGSNSSPSLTFGTSGATQSGVFQCTTGVCFTSNGTTVASFSEDKAMFAKLTQLSSNGTGFMIYSNSDPIFSVTNAGQVQASSVQMLTGAATKPTCNSGNRGVIWYTPGGTGVADKVEICAKGAADSYSYVAMASIT